MSAVDTANNGAATPSFYIIDPISNKKVPVYLDDTDSNDVQWKVDTTSFGITSQVTISDGGNSSTIQKNIMDAYGVNVDPAALTAASSVYLNATETDIGAFLSLSNGDGVKGVASASTFDFGFYTQVVGKDANDQDVVVNIGLDHSYTAGDSWSLNASDVLVKMDYNTIATDNSAAVGGASGDFIEAGGESDSLALAMAVVTLISLVRMMKLLSMRLVLFSAVWSQTKTRCSLSLRGHGAVELHTWQDRW